MGVTSIYKAPYRPSSPAKTLVPLAILLLIAFSAWKLAHTHSSLTRSLAQSDGGATELHCPPCNAQSTQQLQITAATTSGVALAAPPCVAYHSGSADTIGSSSSSSNSSTHSSKLIASGAAGGEGCSSGSCSLNGGSSTVHDAPDNMARDWVFKGGVGSEESRAHFNAIIDAEASKDISPTCAAFGGSQVVKKLRQGGQLLCSGLSAIRMYSSELPNRERPMRVAVLQNASFGADGFQVACSPSPEYQKKRSMGFTDRQYVSTQLFQNITTDSQMCGNPRGVLLLVSANDYWNWWWFLVQLQNAFVALAAVQPDIDQGPRTLMFLEKDNREGKNSYGRKARTPLPFRELYLHLFASRFTPDVRWDDNLRSAYGCYRSVVFLRNSENGSPILKNIQHPWARCFSPVIAALVAHMKAAVNLPTLAAPAIPKVCWISRDEKLLPEFTSWQRARTIKDQAGLVAALNGLASARRVRVVQLAFFGNHSSIQIAEQMHRTSRCSLITGMHGAGLYAAVAMVKPAILEFTTSHIPNRNAQNLMHHIGGCYQGMELVKKQHDSSLDPNVVWPKVLDMLIKCQIIAPTPSTTTK